MKREYNKTIEFLYDNDEKFEVMPTSIEEYAKLEKLYFKIVKRYCKYWLRINFKAVKKFLLGLTDQNWNKIHENEEEEKMSAEDMLSDFRAEFMYISDRFSYTRLLRLHWIWLVFSKKFFKKLNADKGLEFFDDGYVDYYGWLDRNQKQ